MQIIRQTKVTRMDMVKDDTSAMLLTITYFPAKDAVAIVSS